MHFAYISNYLEKMLSFLNLDPSMTEIVSRVVIAFIIVIIAILSDYICKWVINKPLRKIANKTKVTWDDFLFDKGLPNRLAQIVPAFVIYFMLPLVFPERTTLFIILARLSVVYIVAVITRAVGGFITALSELAKDSERFKDRPLKGLFQTLQIIIFFIGLLIILSVIIDKSPGALFAGLGASAAILSFVFKDSLVGLVSGIQLSWNDMLRPGDWITVPNKSVNGVVLEVTLNTVKVRNFDNTIVTIPPSALINDSFQNWRGMVDSSGRRITRSINIDMYSIGFANDQLIEKLSKINSIDKYIKNLTPEAKERGDITNIKLFRIYIEDYLRNISVITKSEMLMVRYLPISSEGLPLEVYFFSSNKSWGYCETLAADVIDHILSIAAKFEIRIYQRASGVDMRKMGNDNDR